MEAWLTACKDLDQIRYPGAPIWQRDIREISTLTTCKAPTLFPIGYTSAFRRKKIFNQLTASYLQINYPQWYASCSTAAMTEMKMSPKQNAVATKVIPFRAASPDVPFSPSDFVRCVRGITSARSATDVFFNATSAARKLTNTDGASFAIRVGGRCHHLSEDEIEPLWEGQNPSLDDDIFGWCIDNRQTVSIMDVGHDSRISNNFFEDTLVHSLLIVPVGSGSPLGALGVFWTYRHPASIQEIEVIQSLAHAAAGALDHINMSATASLNLRESETALDLAYSEQARSAASLKHLLSGPIADVNTYTRILQHIIADHAPLHSLTFFDGIINATSKLSAGVERATSPRPARPAAGSVAMSNAAAPHLVRA